MIKLYIYCSVLIIENVEMGLDIGMKFHQEVMEIVSYDSHIAETLLLGGSLCTLVEKMNRTMTWGDLELIQVISLMPNLKIATLDFAGGTANIEMCIAH